jgi:[acyl-carrier-protein] S-malonyltransferase
MQIASVFPGQGSQQVGMGKELCRRYKIAQEAFEEANDVLGFDLQAMCFKGPITNLMQTEITQTAILTCSVATLRVLQAYELCVDMVAGHSVGQYAALVAAGVISFRQAVETVRLRGILMASVKIPGAMVAVMGLSSYVLADICAKASEHGKVNIALYNSPIQHVVAGEIGGIDKVIELAQDAKAMRTILLPVSQAFHSELMLEMHEEFGSHIENLKLAKPHIPVVLNCSAMVTSDAEEIRKDMKGQCTQAVRWHETIKQMMAVGINAFVEVGYGRTLLGLNRNIDRNLSTWSTEQPEAIAKFIKACATMRAEQVS